MHLHIRAEAADAIVLDAAQLHVEERLQAAASAGHSAQGAREGQLPLTVMHKCSLQGEVAKFLHGQSRVVLLQQ